MFLRRLLLLGGVVALGLLGLFVRLFDLTVVRGAELRTAANARMVREQWTPGIRGRILDRKGRVLAEDRPSYNIAVSYQVICGQWASAQARNQARQIAGSRWADLTRDERDELAGSIQQVLMVHAEQGWDGLAQRLGVPRSELDARRDKIIAMVNARQSQVTQARREKALAALREKNKHKPGFEPSPSQLRSIEREANAPIAETTRTHVLASGVDDAIGFACQSMADHEAVLEGLGQEVALRLGLTETPVLRAPALPGLVVTDSGVREYPMDSLAVDIDTDTFPSPMRRGVASIPVEGLACHVLGSMRTEVYGDRVENGREVLGDSSRRRAWLKDNPEEWDRAAEPDKPPMDRGMYRDGDRVGNWGLEASQEHALRGLRGVQRVRLDSGQRDTLAPVAGRDVTLTLDAMLQARVQALMSPWAGLAIVQPWHLGSASPMQALGSPLYGAAVVIDVDTGEVLAAVSTPTFSRAQLATNPQSVYGDPVTRPSLNRAFGAEYPPGSIVKPLILAEAARRGACVTGERIACNGHLLPDQPTMLQCLIWKRYKTTHSTTLGADPDSVQAVGVSCNIYFFTLGRRLGPAGIEAVYRDFGVEERMNLGAGYEASGKVGSLDGRAISLGDATQMGIGQGPVTWTPLHAAAAYATLARGGEWIAPRVVQSTQPSARRDLQLPKDAVAAAMQGLWFAVNEDTGTGHHILIDNATRESIFNAEGVKVWGKTGTATAPDLKIDPDGPDGPASPEVALSGDHSWFVVLAGRDRPRFAIAVMSEYGGSGARVSGPIANQIIHALIAEGYL